jgi:hypothetical protein
LENWSTLDISVAEYLEMRVRTKRFPEQKWLLGVVISIAGLDWDLLRMEMATAPLGFEGYGQLEPSRRQGQTLQ